jgi:hypothetical protein
MICSEEKDHDAFSAEDAFSLSEGGRWGRPCPGFRIHTLFTVEALKVSAGRHLQR